MQRYARVLVNFALNSGAGLKPKEVVRLTVAESAKPLYVALRNQVLISGGHVLTNYLPDDVTRQYYQLASDKQLQFFPAKYFRGIVDQTDHSIFIISETNQRELAGIDPAKIMAHRVAFQPLRLWQNAKENRGQFTWTGALYGTEGMAREVGLTLQEYWGQIIKACFLDSTDPVASWRQSAAQNAKLRQKLNRMEIERLHIVGQDVNLWVKLGLDRQWLGGGGRNIPSFEVFISPDWRGTQGHISFNQPLYQQGNIVTGIKLEFKDGRVVKSSARKNYAYLKSMLAVTNADKIGEFSLTDKRLSRIDKFMGETLYDENMSGPFGNTHIALGSAFQESYPGLVMKVSKKRWLQLGFNDSVIHTDIISTTDRTVTAHLADGKQKVIYASGKFTI